METPVVNGLTLFENSEFGKVRVVMRDGEIWFVGKDVASALGYADPSRAVVQHCKKAIKTTILVNRQDGAPPLNVSLIPESDMYRLVMRSNTPKAEDFQTWVCEVVLPSIRKTGSYTIAPRSYSEALRKLADEVDAREAAEKALAIECEAHDATRETLTVTAEQRDYYKRTKAEIGTKREASAMGTASAAVKRADKYKTSACELAEDNEAKQRTIDDLNDRIGEGETWRTTKAIGWLLSVFTESKGMWSVVGRKLVAIGNEMGIPPQEIQHQEYGAVKKHHVAVIAEFKSRLENDPSLLVKYRKSG